MNYPIIAYTDGACKGNGKQGANAGGFGTHIIFANGDILDIWGGESDTTNNRMELMGAITALERTPAYLPIQIWTDSGYVKDGISKWIHGWKAKGWKKSDGKAVLNQELWQRLDTACQNRQIDWQWVKGHAGHMGNEYADRLANQGIENLPKTFEKNVIQNTLQNQADNPAFANLPDSFYEQMFDNQTLDDMPEMLDYADDFLLAQLDNDENVSNHIQNNERLYENTTKPLKIIQAKLAENFKPFINENEQFVAQTPELLAMRPEFDGNTKTQNSTFVPLLPVAKNRGVTNRQLILDTETTGLDAQNGDRIIEIGIVELVNRKFTGEKLHVYINPHRKVPESSLKVHGIHDEFLAGMPDFEQVGQAVFEFLAGAELIAHNANFDMGFLQAEFGRLGLDIGSAVRVTDSLLIAKQIYPGQKVSLDALVRKLDVGKKERTFHGALLDAEILAEVYLAMTGGQASLAFDDDMGGGIIQHLRFTTPVQRFVANEDVENAHLAWLQQLVGKNEQLAKNWGLAVDNDKKNAS